MGGAFSNFWDIRKILEDSYLCRNAWTGLLFIISKIYPIFKSIRRLQIKSPRWGIGQQGKE
jgi:hypothetical protein